MMRQLWGNRVEIDRMEEDLREMVLLCRVRSNGDRYRDH